MKKLLPSLIFLALGLLLIWQLQTQSSWQKAAEWDDVTVLIKGKQFQITYDSNGSAGYRHYLNSYYPSELKFDFPEVKGNRPWIQGGTSQVTLFGDIGEHFTSEVAIDLVREHFPSKTADSYRITFFPDKYDKVIQAVTIEKITLQ